MSNDIFNDPNAYLSELQRIEREQELAKLRTLSLEFAGVLEFFPKLREELEAFHHADGIAFDGLADRLRSNLKQAADFQFEIEHLPADVRNAAEMQAFVQQARTTMGLQLIDLPNQLQGVCQDIRQQSVQMAVEKEKAEQAMGDFIVAVILAGISGGITAWIQRFLWLWSGLEEEWDPVSPIWFSLSGVAVILEIVIFPLMMFIITFVKFIPRESEDAGGCGRIVLVYAGFMIAFYLVDRWV